MIIGISGKIGSGKDTVGKIIQYLLLLNKFKDDKFVTFDTVPINVSKISYEEFIQIGNQLQYQDQFQIHKFADTLNDMVCMLINCTREQLEDHKFKDTELGKEWDYWKVIGFNTRKEPMLGSYNINVTKEDCYEECSSKNIRLKNSIEEQETVWTYSPCKFALTPRRLLQLLGTDAGRKIVHPNIWINSLMSKYDTNKFIKEDWNNRERFVKGTQRLDHPNWVITDVRFPNELKAVKDRQGISIRINREKWIGIDYLSPTTTFPIDIKTNDGDEETIYRNIVDYKHGRYYSKTGEEVIEEIVTHWRSSNITEHESEIALDNAEFDEVIDNNEGIPELIEKVKEILIRRNILIDEVHK